MSFLMKGLMYMKVNREKLYMNENRTFYQYRKWDYFVVLIFVLTTGSIMWFQYLSPGFSFSFYFLIACVNLLMKDGKISLVKNSSFYYCIYILLVALIGSFLFYSSYVENTTIGYLASAISSYLIISRYDFFYFRKILTNIVFFITLIGIFVFILSEFHLLPLQSIDIAGGVKIMFYGYQLGWPNIFHRYAGIWHEPGACQIILNTVICLYYNEFVTWKWKKNQLFKIIIIVVGLLLTQSTGGYFVFILFVLNVMFGMKVKYKHPIFFKLLLFVVGGVIIWNLYHSPIIQEKIYSDESGNESVSKVQRTTENLAMFQMFLERPLLGWGLGSHEQIEMFDKLDNGGCSNGILYMLCSWGLMWFIPFIWIVYKNMRQMYGQYYFMMLLAFLMMQSNERYLEFPISFIFMFQFKKESLI